MLSRCTINFSREYTCRANVRACIFYITHSRSQNLDYEGDAASQIARKRR